MIVSTSPVVDPNSVVSTDLKNPPQGRVQRLRGLLYAVGINKCNASHVVGVNLNEYNQLCAKSAYGVVAHYQSSAQSPFL